MNLDLIISKLLLPKEWQYGQTPLFTGSLAHLLSRGTVSFSAQPIYSWLTPDAPALSVAAVTAYADGLGNGRWLRADPIHQRVQRDNVQLLDPAMLDVALHEATQLIASLNAHFAEDGLVFHAPVASRWYIALPETEMPTTQSIDKVIGKSVFDFQPQSHGNINWKALGNEIQMLLFEHPVNLAREAAGKYTINGVWCWGEGRQPDATLKLKWIQVFAQEPYLAGLSRLSATPFAIVANTADDLAVLSGDVLVWLDALDNHARRNDVAAWNAALQELEATWFKPLHTLLTNRKITQLKLHLPTETGVVTVELTPRSLWKFWRKNITLQSYA